ncbi:MAG: DUF4054 domain-containing protein [Clostridia bacterium]|nr:DUF4054 domain-containing protein [Clostridia bacterium]
MSANPLSIEQYIQAVAPALLQDPSLDVFIEMAKERTDRAFYGVKYNHAVALMASHIAFLLGAGTLGAGSGNAEGGSTGSVTSKREGDLSVSYGAGAVSASAGNLGDAELSHAAIWASPMTSTYFA